MANSAVQRRRWEERQSAYLLVLVTPWSAWAALVYAGIRGRHPAWVLWGLLYASPLLVDLALDPARYGFAMQLRIAMGVTWIAAIVHALTTRSDFIFSLQYFGASHDDGAEAEVEEAPPSRLGRLHHQTGSVGATEAGAERPLEADADDAPSTPRTPGNAGLSKSMRGRILLDINTADAEDLDGLPGIDFNRASQIVAMRGLLGKYQSFDHLAERNSIDPVLREKLRPLFLDSGPAGSTTGRVVEAGESQASAPVKESKAPGRRIVDL